MRWMGAIVGVLLLLEQPPLAFCQQGSQSDREVLRLLREAISRFNSLDLQASTRSQFPSGGGEPGVSTRFLTVKRLDSRALISWKDVISQPGAETWRQQQEFLVYESGDVLQCQAKLDPSLKQIDGQNGLAFTIHSKRLAESQVLDLKSVYNGLNDFGAALWIIGYAPLLDYLDGASNVEVAQAEMGAQIRADGDLGRLELTTSSSSGWLPQSFEIVKEPEHKTIGGRVADVYQGLVRSVVWAGKAEGFTSDSEGRWAPTKMDVQRRTEWKEKPAETDRTTINFERLAFAPPFQASDFQVSISAPVGYPVTVRGAEQLPYKWDGWAVAAGVPDLPPIANQQIEYNKLEKVAGSNRTLIVLILFNVLLVLVFFVVLWRRRGMPR